MAIMESNLSSVDFNDFDVSASSAISTPHPIHQSTPLRVGSRTHDFIEDNSVDVSYEDNEDIILPSVDLSYEDTLPSVDVSMPSSIDTSYDLPSIYVSNEDLPPILGVSIGMDVTHNSLVFNDFDAQTGCPPEHSDASQLLGSVCCESRCLATLSLMEVESCRKSFNSHEKIEQQQFLLDSISLTTSKGGKRSYSTLPLAGKQLCMTAFIKVLKISKKRLRNIRNLHIACGATIMQKRLRRDRPKSSKYSAASAWMERYFGRIGDKMPRIEQIHLPHFLSKKLMSLWYVISLMRVSVWRA
jgi:hypothetical protein